MSFDVPTQAQIVQRVAADFRAEAGVNPLRRSIEYALLRAIAGQSKGLYSLQEDNFKQAFPNTAEEHNFWRWAAVWNITQKGATPWTGVVRFSGVDTSVIPAGTEITRTDGQTYTTDEDSAIAGSTADVAVTASEGGVLGGNDDDSPLTLSGVLSGVDSDVTVVSTTTDGTDVETVEDGLVRLVQRLQHQPGGGTTGDYVRWALEVEGNTRAWERSPAAGEVYVSIVRDNDGEGDEILQDSGERAESEAYIQSKAPITVEVTVVALTGLAVPVQISNLVPNTLAVRTAIETALKDFFVREAAAGGTISLSRLDEAISSGTGETSHTLDSPSTDIVAAVSEIPIFDGLTVV
jgi:uncharacterized phage protein gp47/JayE